MTWTTATWLPGSRSPSTAPPGALWDNGHLRLLIDAALRIDADRLVPPVGKATIRDGALVCPQCGCRDSIVEIDTATRENKVSVFSAGILSVHQEDAHFETDRFQCTGCGHEVALPFAVCCP